MNDDRGSWYLLTALVLGVALGLLYAWVIAPVQYVDTAPDTLQEEYKDAYRVGIAAAYAATNDLARARARLALLGDPNSAQTLAAQAQRHLAEGRRYEDAQALALLASALGEAPTPVAITASYTETPAGRSSPTLIATTPLTLTPSLTFTPTVTPTQVISPTANLTSTQTITNTTLTPQATRTQIPTLTPLPTRTPTPTKGPPFVLAERTQVCDPNLGEPLIQVFVTNAADEGVSGVEVIIQWEDTEESFYTGLKPEFGPGYADFQMTPGVAYTLHIADGGELIQDLVAPECSITRGERYWGSWMLAFTQP